MQGKAGDILHKVQALEVVGVKTGVICRPGGGEGTVDGLIALAVGVGEMELQALEPGGVGRVLLQAEGGFGGGKLQVVHQQPLAVHLHPPVHRDLHHRGGLGRVQGELEGVGVVQLLLLPLHIAAPQRNVQGEGLRDLLQLLEVDLKLLQLLRAGGAVDRVPEQGSAVCVLQVAGGAVGEEIAVGAVKDHHLLLVGNHIVQGEGGAVKGLALAHILHIVVLHRGGQAGGKGHRRRQLPQHGDLGAGQGKGGKGIHCHHKGGAHPGHTPQGDSPALAPAMTFGPVPGPQGGAVQGGGRMGKLPHQVPIFLLSVHDAPSSVVRSSFKRARALRCRVDTVPRGSSRAAAVSSRVRPVK